MIVYSKKIFQFIQDIKSSIKEILSREVRVKVFNDRFYDLRQESSYPISVVIYNNKSMLGYFDSAFYELGFHECLMLSSKEQLQHIIKHELAHYITFINYGCSIQQPHGIEFKAFCQRMGWGEEVYRATTCLDDGRNVSDIDESSVFRKVKKLMALSTSSNSNEAELAMIKSQQLLLKHNVETKYIDGDDNEKMFIKRILKQTKENAKMRAIAQILKTFFVNTVYRRGDGFIHLEILGTAVNVEIAEYVANILQHEFDKLWDQARRQHVHLKGMVAKNSFFLGIAQGYCNKINSLKRDYDPATTNALLVIEKTLIDAKELVYPRLSSGRSSGSHCHHSSAIGQEMGRQLNINPALQQSRQNSEVFLLT